MRKEISSKEVDHLAELLRNDALAEEDAERLRAIIRSHPSARRRLAEHLYCSAILQDQLRDVTVDADPVNIVQLEKRKSSRLLIPLAAAAALVMGFGFWKLGTVQGGGNSPGRVVNEDSVQSDAEGIAVISRTRGVVWGSATTLDKRRLNQGLPVGPGIIELKEGRVQIDFYSGATVMLESPALLEIESPMLSRLQYGNLWAQVPVPARGFRIETSSMDIVDLGTEFGVRLSEDGIGEVHVLDGEVQISPEVQVAEEGKEQLLRRGEGVRWMAGGDQQAIKACPETFDASRTVAEEARKRLEAWREFSNRLKSDPDSLVVYQFEADSSWDRRVDNLAAHGQPSTYGAVVGCEWTKGRWPGKGALQFSNSSHRVRLNVPGEYDALTLACWVRVDSIPLKRIALLHPDTTQDRFVHWTLVKTGKKKVCAHFSESDGRSEKNRRHYFFEHPLNGEDGSVLGEWMQLVVVYDPEAGNVRQYHNGRLVGAKPLIEVNKVSIGSADIGNWPYLEWAKGTEFEFRNLDGAIDEFLILKKAWSDAEVLEHWKSGQP